MRMERRIMRLTVSEFQLEYNAFMQGSMSQMLSRNFFACNHDRLPEFFSGKFLPEEDYRLENSERLPAGTACEIPIDHIYGFSWLFESFDTPQARDEGRPLPERLANIFCNSPDKIIQPIPLIDIGNERYIANDGNHRIYSAYLRQWKTIPAYIEGRLR